MLTVTFSNDTTTFLKGHAGVGKHAEACIAVSALAGVFAEAGEKLGGFCRLCSGCGVLDFPRTPEGLLLSDVLRRGLILLHNTYPDKIRIVRKEERK